MCRLQANFLVTIALFETLIPSSRLPGNPEEHSIMDLSCRRVKQAESMELLCASRRVISPETVPHPSLLQLVVLQAPADKTKQICRMQKQVQRESALVVCILRTLLSSSADIKLADRTKYAAATYDIKEPCLWKLTLRPVTRCQRMDEDEAVCICECFTYACMRACHACPGCQRPGKSLKITSNLKQTELQSLTLASEAAWLHFISLISVYDSSSSSSWCFYFHR